MKLLVFQHLDCEHPGSLRWLLDRNDIAWDTVELDKNDTIPDLAGYDVLWVMGGPMDVWDVEAHPWLVAEKAAIRSWVRDMEKPYLGLCLGHQLLADALGGTCGPLSPPEIGVMEVELTAAGQADPLFAGVPSRHKCLQWHSVRVAQAPEDAIVLAQSETCSNQAMRIGRNAWSLQYHVEVEPDTVSNWAAIPAYRDALVQTMGKAAVGQMKQEAKANMDDFMLNAETLFKNFMNAIK